MELDLGCESESHSAAQKSVRNGRKSWSGGQRADGKVVCLSRGVGPVAGHIRGRHTKHKKMIIAALHALSFPGEKLNYRKHVSGCRDGSDRRTGR